MWGGMTSAKELRAIADVVEKFAIPAVKCTGGQRIDMLGVKKEDLPAVWADLNKAGMVSGAAYAKGLRTVKTCVGTDWCRFGTQDSTGLGVKLEKFLWGSWTPAKLKLAVSGCPRNCAEATCKDIGVICVDSGYDIHFGGAAGLDIKGTELLGHVATEDEAIEVIAALTQLYREQGRYLERIYKWMKRVGVDTVRKQVLDDRERRTALYERFVHSQTFAQIDPWAERVAGKAAHEFSPVADLTARPPNEQPVHTHQPNALRDGSRTRACQTPTSGSKSAPLTTSHSVAAAWSAPPRRHRTVSHRRDRRLRTRRSLPARGRPSEPGHRARPRRDLPVAQLGDQPRDRHGDRRRQGAGANDSSCGSSSAWSRSADATCREIHLPAHCRASHGLPNISVRSRRCHSILQQGERPMAYLAPAEFVSKMIDAGESKVFMSTKDTLIRAYMAGAILALAAAFAVTVTVQTGQPLAGAVLFPVGFILLYLLGFDLLTGVFTLAPLALLDKRPGVTWQGILRNWWLVFWGNFAGAFTVALMMAVIFTFGFSQAPGRGRPEDRPHRRGPHGRLRGARRRRHADALHPRGAVQLDGLDRRRRRDDVDLRLGQDHGHVDADHGVLLHGLRALDREHVPVPVGPAARRQLLADGLPALERDPDRHRQPRRRPRLRRPDALLDALQDRAEARGASLGVARSRPSD